MRVEDGGYATEVTKAVVKRSKISSNVSSNICCYVRRFSVEGGGGGGDRTI